MTVWVVYFEHRSWARSTAVYATQAGAEAQVIAIAKANGYHVGDFAAAEESLTAGGHTLEVTEVEVQI